MATTFETWIMHEDATYAEQAAWEAFQQLDRLENELSRFIETSDISRINHAPPHHPVKVNQETFGALQQCAHLFRDTHGVFDITLGNEIDCWKNPPSQPAAIEKAPEVSQDHKREFSLLFHPDQWTVQRTHADVLIDLGGFGKGYGLDIMAQGLLEWDIETALLHGGWSTVLALAAPPDSKGWPVTISHPDTGETLALFHLRNQALSGSGMKQGQHIIDPRSLQPVRERLSAWAFAETASLADALSTAFLIMDTKEIKTYCQTHPHTQAILLSQNKSAPLCRFGFPS